jgi:dTDP-4-dehydrorhamnose 3,5-epimerase
VQVQNLALEGMKLITCKKVGDERGFFCERFRQEDFIKAGLPESFVQENFSRSQVGVLRGLHYQYDRPQGKLITCLRGKIFDVALDVRAQSKTFGQHFAVELDGNNPQWLWVPPGFAHGFCTTSEEGADILYKVTEYYNPAGESGISWQDPALKIQWPKIATPILSARDQQQKSFQSYAQNPAF